MIMVLLKRPYRKIRKGKLTNEIVYLNALEEEKYNYLLMLEYQLIKKEIF